MIVAPCTVSLFLSVVPVAIANKASTYDGVALIPVFQDIVGTLIVKGLDILKRVVVANFQQIAFPIGKIASVDIPHDDCVVILLDVTTANYIFPVFVENNVPQMCE